MAYEGNDSLYMGLNPEAWQRFGNSEGMVGDGSMGGNLLQKGFDVGSIDTGGFDISKMLSGGLGGIGSLFSAEKGGTSVMGGLAPYMQMGMSYLADKKNDPTRANNEAIQRQQIASNTYNADKLRRNDAALGRAFGTA